MSVSICAENMDDWVTVHDQDQFSWVEQNVIVLVLYFADFQNVW